MGLSVTAILDAIAPGFNANPSAATFIEMATAETNAGYFGAFYNKAIALRAAHEWTLSTRAGNESGALSSRRLGPAAVSFQPSAGGSSLSLTRFGRELESLINRAGVGASVTGHTFYAGE